MERHCSLVVERSHLVHEVRGSKSDSEIMSSHFSSGFLALFRAGEGQKTARKGTGHPTSSCRGFVHVFLYKAHTYAIV